MNHHQRSLKDTLPALLTLAGGAIATVPAGAAGDARPVVESSIEARVADVRDRLHTLPGVEFSEVSRETGEGLRTFWWGNWHNGGWGPGYWHNWGNGGWHNWGNGWPNWHNWHNWGNW
jgi:rSAM-associated Gly-rich repeat protein